MTPTFTLAPFASHRYYSQCSSLTSSFPSSPYLLLCRQFPPCALTQPMRSVLLWLIEILGLSNLLAVKMPLSLGETRKSDLCARRRGLLVKPSSTRPPHPSALGLLPLRLQVRPRQTPLETLRIGQMAAPLHLLLVLRRPPHQVRFPLLKLPLLPRAGILLKNG